MKRISLFWLVGAIWFATQIAANIFPILWPLEVLSSLALLGIALPLLIRPYGTDERQKWYCYILALIWGLLLLFLDFMRHVDPLLVALAWSNILKVAAGISILIFIIGGVLEPKPTQQEIEHRIRDLRHPDKVVRLQALLALGKARKPKTLEPLIGALADEDEFIRYSAVDALGATGDERALGPLLRALQDPDPVLRDSAVSALGKLGFAEAVPSLIDALSDDDPSVRVGAAWALGELKDSRGVQPLIRALKDSDPDVRATAIEALGELGDPAALPMLQWIQQHDSGSASFQQGALKDIATAAIKEIQKRQVPRS